MPHHVTFPGNRRLQTFFNDEGRQAYLELVSEWRAGYKVQIWAYCLMPNHVHLIAAPDTKEGLNLAIGDMTGASIFGRNGAVIYGREGSHPLSWTSTIYWPVRDM